jgi:hypothetical protein
MSGVGRNGATAPGAAHQTRGLRPLGSRGMFNLAASSSTLELVGITDITSGYTCEREPYWYPGCGRIIGRSRHGVTPPLFSSTSAS